MGKDGKKILFITPGASRVGGNIILLDFLRWFKKNNSTEFVTIYGHGGEIEEDFKALSPAYNFRFEKRSNSFFLSRIYNQVRNLEAQIYWLKRRIERENIGLIYNNAVTNEHILSVFSNLKVPVISHCHELESVIYRTGLAEFRQTKNRTAHFIAVAEAVRQNLIENHQVPAEKISLVYGFIPVSSFSETELRKKRKKILDELGIPQNAFVVGASGTLYWRKAPELFIQIAREIHRKEPGIPIYFLWVGGAQKDDFKFFELNYDVKKLGLEKYVHFLEHKSNPLDYFAAFDVFALVSREEPFGLVALESASLGKPIICFAEAGGLPELVEEDSGFTVPYLDIEAFAAKIKELFNNPQLKEFFGKNASNKVRQNHDISIAAPKITKIIENFMVKK